MWKCNGSSNVSLMSKFFGRKKKCLAGEILEKNCTALSFFAIAGKCNYGFFLPFPPPFALFCVEMQCLLKCLLNVKVFREEKACRGNIGENCASNARGALLSPMGWDHRENQSAEAAAINIFCKPRRLAGGFFVSEFAPISLTKPFQKER